MSQKELFEKGEGDGWYRRNTIAGARYADLKKTDPALVLLRETGLEPCRVLEIGASNGWRLHALKEDHPGATVDGVEPSAEAVAAAHPGIKLTRGTAEKLPFADAAFDLVIFGFCLYLCDRADLFKVAAEADRVLADGGHVLIYDCHVPGAYKNPYAHAPGAFTYKMDYARLFLWNPAYSLIERRIQALLGPEDVPDNHVAVQLLKKNLAGAWPDRPGR